MDNKCIFKSLISVVLLVGTPLALTMMSEDYSVREVYKLDTSKSSEKIDKVTINSYGNGKVVLVNQGKPTSEAFLTIGEEYYRVTCDSIEPLEHFDLEYTGNEVKSVSFVRSSNYSELITIVK